MWRTVFYNWNQEDTKSTVLRSTIFIYTKVTVLQTDDTMDPTMEEGEEGSEPEANSEVTI